MFMWSMVCNDSPALAANAQSLTLAQQRQEASLGTARRRLPLLGQSLFFARLRKSPEANKKK